MKYIVYETINKVNNKIYIGVHGTESDDFDGYIGNGISIFRPSTYMHPKTPMQFAVKKYGIKNFIRTTIKEFDNEKDAYKLEAELVDEDFLKRDDVYNLALGGKLNYDNLHNPKKEVHMYDLDGNYIRSFSGINIAARTINPNAENGSHISRAIKTGGIYQNYQWSYEKVPFMKKKKVRKSQSYTSIPDTGPQVGRFDDEGNLLEVFNTATDCRRAGYTNALKVLHGEREKCKGFRFKYLD